MWDWSFSETFSPVLGSVVTANSHKDRRMSALVLRVAGANCGRILYPSGDSTLSLAPTGLPKKNSTFHCLAFRQWGRKGNLKSDAVQSTHLHRLPGDLVKVVSDVEAGRGYVLH